MFIYQIIFSQYDTVSYSKSESQTRQQDGYPLVNSNNRYQVVPLTTISDPLGLKVLKIIRLKVEILKE